MKKNENGFSVVEVLVVVVIVGLLAAVGWLVYDRQKNEQSSQAPATTQNTESKASSEQSKKDELREGFSKHAIGDTGVTLVYPSSWGEAKQTPSTGAGSYEVNGIALSVQKDKAVVISRSFNAPSTCTYNATNKSWAKTGEYLPSSCEPSVLAVSGIKAQGFNKGALGAYGFTYATNLKGDSFLLISDSILADGTPEKDPATYPSQTDIDKLKSELDKNVEIILTNNQTLFE